MRKTKQQYLFEKKLQDNLTQNRLIKSGETVLVAISGGADSVCLLYALNNIKDSLGIYVIAAHLNHGIRQTAKRDCDFVIDFTNKLGIKLYTETVDVPKTAAETGKGLEEAARDLRYAFLERIADSYGADKIATAHNMNDNAETVIFNIVRGTGLNGIGGIKAQRGRIIRPFLCFDRTEIERYVEECGLAFVQDETNADTAYTRNYIRHEIMPLLMKINPQAHQNIFNLSQNAAADEELLNHIALNELDKISEHTSVISRRLAADFEAITTKTLNAKHINAVVEAVKQKDIQKHYFDLPDEIIAIVANGTYTLEKKQKADVKNLMLTKILDNGITVFGDWFIEVGGIKNKFNSSDNIYKFSISYTLDFDKINGCLNARSRQIGDSFICHGINRNLKKHLINNKIEAQMRDGLPVICDDDGIVAVPFVGVADRVFSKDTQNPLYIWIYWKK